MTERSGIEKTDAIYPCDKHQFINQDPCPERDRGLWAGQGHVSVSGEGQPTTPVAADGQQYERVHGGPHPGPPPPLISKNNGRPNPQSGKENLPCGPNFKWNTQITKWLKEYL